MTAFKKYLLYDLKKNVLRSAVFAFIAAVVSVVYVASYDTSFDSLGFNYFRTVYGGMGYGYYYDTFTYVYVTALLLSLFIPVFQNYQMKRKRDLDLLFSLPVSRTAIAAGSYLSGLIQSAGIILVQIVTGAISSVFFLPYFKVIPFIYMYAGVIFGIVCYYSIVNFLISKANTVIDGAFSVAGFYLLWNNLSALCREILYLNQNDHIKYYLTSVLKFSSQAFYISSSDPFFLIHDPVRYSERLIDMSTYYGSYITYSEYHGQTIGVYLMGGVIFFILAVLSVIFYMKSFKEYRAENAGGVSDTGYGLKFLIPAVGLSSILLTFFDSGALPSVAVLIIMFGAYCLYRRSFRLKLSDITVLGAGVIYAAVSAIVNAYGGLL